MTQRFNPPAVRRLSAVAIAAALAAFAGAAAAQSQSGYVTDSRGNVVRNSLGECVRPGVAPAPTAPCPPAASARAAAAPQQLAQSSRGQPARPAAASASAAGGTTPAATAPARMPGYAVSSDGRVVLSGFGQCVRAGHWTPQNAAEPCDRIAVANVPPPPPVVAEAPKPPEVKPEPAPLAQPAPAPEPPRPVIQKLTLSTDVLFDFDKAELRDAGKQKLDELITQTKDADVDEVVVVGHADRIASEQYNQKLSEERAQAVKSYLEERGVKGRLVTAEGKGELQPVTGDDCKKMGPERGNNRKLVACLQPDRRVEIEVLGSRQLAAGEAPAAGGGAGTTGSSPAPAGGGATAR